MPTDDIPDALLVKCDGQLGVVAHEIHIAHDGAPRDLEFLGNLVAIGIGLFPDEVMKPHHAFPRRAAERLGFGGGHILKLFFNHNCNSNPLQAPPAFRTSDIFEKRYATL